MEPEGSSVPLQEAATCSCPEPDQSIPQPWTDILKIHFNTILPQTPISSKWTCSKMFDCAQNGKRRLERNPYYFFVTEVIRHTGQNYTLYRLWIVEHTNIIFCIATELLRSQTLYPV
jgi:hypothetical protein